MSFASLVTSLGVAAVAIAPLSPYVAAAEPAAPELKLDCACKVFRGYEDTCYSGLEIKNGELWFAAFETSGKGPLKIGEHDGKPLYSADIKTSTGGQMSVYAYVPRRLDAVEVTLDEFDPDEWAILMECR